MSEKEPISIQPKNEPHLNRAQKIAYYANEIANHHDLDTLTYEALSKFAVANLRIREVQSDFSHVTYDVVRYPVYEDVEGKLPKRIITRETYRDFIISTSAIAFNLYNVYLSKNPASRAAAREVQILVNDEYPKEL